MAITEQTQAQAMEAKCSKKWKFQKLEKNQWKISGSQFSIADLTLQSDKYKMLLKNQA